MKKTKNLQLNQPEKNEYFDVELLNENAEKIDDAIEKEQTRIGDIKITTREINDPSWLFCNNTHISEEEYPDLYYAIAAAEDASVFIKEWRSVDFSNKGYAPLFAADGYLYFFPVNTSISSISRCNADYTGFETYDLPYTGTVCYENGYFFLFGFVTTSSKTQTEAVFCSNDGFKTYTKIVISSSVYSDYDNYERSYVRYAEGKWFLRLCASDMHSDFLMSDAVEGPYTRAFYFDGIHQPSDDTSHNYPLSDIIQYKNGTYFGLLKNLVSTGAANRIYVCRRTDPIDYAADDKIVWKKYKTGSFSHTAKLNEDSNNKPIYIPEIDTVFCCTSSGIFAYKNDGTSFFVPAAGSPTNRMQIVYFKGYVYFKEVGSKKITRVNANYLYDIDYETSTEYVTSYPLSASEERIFMPKDSTTMYYMETDAEVMIPALSSDTIFKTYIKAK